MASIGLMQLIWAQLRFDFSVKNCVQDCEDNSSKGIRSKLHLCNSFIIRLSENRRMFGGMLPNMCKVEREYNKQPIWTACANNDVSNSEWMEKHHTKPKKTMLTSVQINCNNNGCCSNGSGKNKENGSKPALRTKPTSPLYYNSSCKRVVHPCAWN